MRTAMIAAGCTVLGGAIVYFGLGWYFKRDMQRWW